MSKKLFQILCLVTLLSAFSACKKVQKESDPVKQVRQKSKLELFCQEWILHTTYENNVIKTQNGTSRYQYTRQGDFNYLYNGNWTNVGTYDFTGSDSTAFGMVFTGTSNPVIMNITTLNETTLNTSFTTGGTDYIYMYKR